MVNHVLVTKEGRKGISKLSTFQRSKSCECLTTFRPSWYPWGAEMSDGDGSGMEGRRSTVAWQAVSDVNRLQIQLT